MANCSCHERSRGTPGTPTPPSSPEPEVRRWPHPVGCVEQSFSPDATLYCIRCALSCQNELLAEIKALLEQHFTNTMSNEAEK